MIPNFRPAKLIDVDSTNLKYLMMQPKIPTIIHQIWSGIDEPLPNIFKKLGETWKKDYPDWQYEFWDNDKIISFIQKYYPQYWDAYNRFQYNVQRWDAIRYLILHQVGGIYVDFDYESLIPMNNLLQGRECCFAEEPESHCKIFNRRRMFNNALMASIPNHPFIKKIINKVFSDEIVNYRDSNKNTCVWKTTGPWSLIDLYEKLSYEEKESIYLIPDKYVTPFDVMQARRFRSGEVSDELESSLDEAYALHYFFNSWLVNDK